MDIDLFAFLLAVVWRIVDFTRAGVTQLRLSGETAGPTQNFIIGLAGLLLIVALNDLAWLSLLVFSPYLALSSHPFLRHVVTAVFVAIVMTTVINRRKWWGRMLASGPVEDAPPPPLVLAPPPARRDATPVVALVVGAAVLLGVLVGMGVMKWMGLLQKRGKQHGY